MDRKQMRTECIQKEFQSVYANFYTKHNIIISVPHIMHRWHAITKNKSQIKIKQKIPTRLYWWINLIKDNIIKFWSVLTFLHNDNKFEENSFDFIFSNINKIHDIILNLFNEYWYDWWIELGLLTENQRWHWFSFSWSFCCLLAYIIYVITGRISMKSSKLVEESKLFKELFELSMKIDKKFWWTPTWATSYATMSEKWTPVIQWWEELKSKSSKRLLQFDDNIKSLSIDYGIINYWLSYSWDQIEWIYNTIINEYMTTMETLKEFVDDKKIKPDEKIFDKMSLYLNWKLLNNLEALISNPFSYDIINKFIVTIWEHWLFNSLLEKDYKLLIETLYLFDELKVYPDEKIWLIPVSSGKTWWCLLFVTYHEKSRETMERLLQRMKQKWYNKISYEYLSWKDWYSYDGLKLEQYIWEKVFSNYIKEWSVLYENSQWVRYIWEHRDIIITETDWILFDMIDNKIYINWEWLTYQEVRSQSWTIEIMAILFNNLWNHVNNGRFPVSTYAKNKNEMMWKILWPLQESVEKRFWKKLDIKSSWAISNYDTIMKSWTIKIWFIKAL